MKRSALAVLLALMLVGAVAAPVAAVRPTPTPTYSAVLTTDGACAFTLKASWKNAPVDKVYALWYLDGSFLLTMEAPFTGPNAGTIKGKTATFHAGPFTPTTESHAWHVLVQFYGGNANLGEVTSNTVPANCGVPAG